MSHRSGKNKGKQNAKPKYACKGFRPNYWGSQDYNTRLYNYYRDLLLKMATNRFRWINLPKSCDERFLNLTLALEGVACIAFPKKMPGMFFSTRAVFQGQPNVYDNYTKWQSFGNNGWRFDCDASNGVLVWENSTRFPIMESIDLYATELVHIRMTKNMNRFHQQIPYILSGPQEKLYDMQQITKQVAGGELAMITTNGLEAIEAKTIATDVPFLGSEIAEDEQFTWNQIYTMLGIENNPFKSERQTEDEIRAQKSPAQIVRMSTLSQLRKACDKLNNRFGKYLTDGEIKVVWNQDNFSENWNMMHNDASLIKTMGGRG